MQQSSNINVLATEFKQQWEIAVRVRSGFSQQLRYDRLDGLQVVEIPARSEDGRLNNCPIDRQLN